MRIIGGLHKGKTISPPKGLLLRPTTDFAKEGLFNILTNKFDFENCRVLDLFGGTGNISFEFASRGADVSTVDKNYNCVKYINNTAKLLNLNVVCFKSDVFTFLKNENNTYDIIFADPPYDMQNTEQIYDIVSNSNLLKAGGLLIIEHGPKLSLGNLNGFIEQRKYGNVNFSFFTFNKTT